MTQRTPAALLCAAAGLLALSSAIPPAMAQDVPALRTRRGVPVGLYEFRYVSTVLTPTDAPRVVLHGAWQALASADGRTLLCFGDPMSRPIPNEFTVAVHRDGALVFALERTWLTGSRFDVSEDGDVALVGTTDGATWEARHLSPRGDETFRVPLEAGGAYRSVTAWPGAILAHRIDASGRMAKSVVVRIDASGEHELCAPFGPCELIAVEDAFFIRHADRLELYDAVTGRRRWSAPGAALAQPQPVAPPAGVAHAQQPVWPLAGGDRDVLIDFGSVHFLSYLQGFDYSHKGVDLHGRQPSGQLGDQVVAMRSGVIVDVDAPLQESNAYVIVEVPLPGGGSEWDAYLHTVPVGLIRGTPVAAGATLGVVASGGCWSERLSHHLHIARMTNWQASWGNGELSPYSHMVDPLEPFTAPGDRDPLQALPRLVDADAEPGDFRVVDAANSTGPGLDFAFGAVDLVCEVGDDKSSLLGWRQGVQSVGYWIEALTPRGDDVRSAAEPYVLCRMDGAWNAGYVQPSRFVSLAHPALQGSAQVCWDMAFSYLLTNTNSTTGSALTIDATEHWGTDASLSSVAPNGSDGQLAPAREIQEARFADGRYRVHCLLEDRVHGVDETRDVTVDNFRPYVRAIQIRGQVTPDAYDAEWTWSRAPGELRLTPTDLAAEAVSFDEAEDITLTLDFSEPVRAASIGIVPPLASGFVPTLEPVAGAEGLRWRGVIPSSRTSAQADAGIHRVSIRCVDSNGTPIVATGSTAPRPANFNKRTSAAVIVDPTSLDVLHRFGIRP